MSGLNLKDSLNGAVTAYEGSTVVAMSVGNSNWMWLNGAPYVTVSGMGTTNVGTVTVMNNGANFGPDTVVSGTLTTTNGLQEAINYAQSNLQGGIPVGGYVRVVDPAFTLPNPVSIPCSLGFTLDADSITYTGTVTADAFTIGANYAAIGKVLLGGPTIRIGLLTGGTPGAYSSYVDTGSCGLHIYQMIGGHIEIGTVREFSKAAIFCDNSSSVSVYDACGNSFFKIGTATSNGVGFKANSNSPSGSFFGSNDIYIGDAISNFVGVCIDATPATVGVFTYGPTSNSVNNRFSFTAEGSASIGGPTDGCDAFLNCNYSFFNINAGHLRVRGGNNYVISTDNGMTYTQYVPTNHNIFVNPGKFLKQWGNGTPSLPVTTGSTVAVENTYPTPVMVYLPYSIGGSQYGVHIVDSYGTDKALNWDPPMSYLDVGASMYFQTAVPTSWFWYGI